MSVCNSSTTVSVAPSKPCLPPLPAITSLHGILLDFDPDRFHPHLATPAVMADPQKLLENHVGVWLSRHPIFARARVVDSGRGLHVIVQFSEPVQFKTANDRSKWAAVVKIVQRILPTDLDCPGITALTRPIGSTNGKSGQPVKLLSEGEPVDPEEVLEFCVAAIAKPFGTLFQLLFGDVRISPCPVCRGDETRLDALDHIGRCYGGCGKVTPAAILDLFLKPRPVKKGGPKPQD